MARAREISDLECGEPYGLAAAKVVEVRAGELFEQSNGVLDVSQIERVHDMRVASRRLRAAMEIFEPCFPGKRFRRTLKEVKALADALGQRRDRDVAIAFLEDFSEHVTASDRRGIGMLLERLREEQAEANDDLVPFVSDQRMAVLRDSVARLCDAARESAREEESPEPERQGPEPEVEHEREAAGDRAVREPAR